MLPDPKQPLISERFLPSEMETAALGASLSDVLRPGDTVALWGDLGAGKTTLARGLVQAALGVEQETPSPTFTLVQLYDLPAGTLWHVDLYRLEAPEDALELGLEDAFFDAICLIEWPIRLGPYLPKNRLDISLETKRDGRHIQIMGEDAWRTRLGPNF